MAGPEQEQDDDQRKKLEHEATGGGKDLRYEVGDKKEVPVNGLRVKTGKKAYLK